MASSFQVRRKGQAVLARLLLQSLAAVLVVLPLLVKEIAGQQYHDSNDQAQHAGELDADKPVLVR